MKTNIFSLDGRCSLITGGSKGLGKAIATSLASQGSNIVLAARNERCLRETATEIRKAHRVKVESICADLTKRADVMRLARSAPKIFGQIDILVNNAGTYENAQLSSIGADDIDRQVALNLTSLIYLTKELALGMKSRKWGRIINISSILAVASRPGSLLYSTTKAGIIGLTHASATELGPFGITVNCIAPGPFNNKNPDEAPTTQQRKQFAKWTALGRWGKPCELAGISLLLASEAGSYITGSVIVVDGGASARILT